MIILPARLQAAAEQVRQDAVFADIGTDHALLPLFLLEQNKIKEAYATDVCIGPIEKAKANISKYPFATNIHLLLTDGLNGLENKNITDIAICGMGGELITKILSESTFIKNTHVQLLLQPMSRPGALRSFLCENGFQIDFESISFTKPHWFPFIKAHYTGTPYTLAPCELEMGPFLIEHQKDVPLFSNYLSYQIERYTKRVQGQKQSGTINEHDERLLKGFKELL